MAADVQSLGGTFLIEMTSVQQFIEAQSRIAPVVPLQQSQCDSLLHRISVLTKFDVSLATSITTLIQAGPWTANQKELLAAAVQSRLERDPSAASPTGRRKNQKLVNFEKYLTDTELTVLQDTNIS
jgi:hypothetical protein